MAKLSERAVESRIFVFFVCVSAGLDMFMSGEDIWSGRGWEEVFVCVFGGVSWALGMFGAPFPNKWLALLEAACAHPNIGAILQACDARFRRC